MREDAAALGLSATDVVSGAGHDAVYLARLAPTAMVFVRCCRWHQRYRDRRRPPRTPRGRLQRVAARSGFIYRSESLSAALIECDSAGVTSSDYALFPFRNVRRPVFPLDPL